MSTFLCASAWAKPAVVLNTNGTVEKRDVGSLNWVRVVPGERIAEGGVIRTGVNSQAELETDRGHIFKLRSETTFELTSLQDDQTQGRLEKGRLLSKVKKLGTSESFKIQTAAAVCAVRGTQFDTMANEKKTLIAVYEGVVGVAALGGGDEMALKAGQMTTVAGGTIDIPRPIPKEPAQASASNPLASEARHEVGLDMDRNEIIAAAAMEQRMADYVEGKSLVDVNGKRVRLEEYIVRSRADQFKFVVLNHRDERLDYFYYKGTFNKDLPTDLSVALRDLSGKLGTEIPEYYLTEYEMAQSNTQDSIKDTAAGGHRVRIDRNSSGDFVLTEYDSAGAITSNTRTIEDAELLGDGTYKIYNPLSDSFITVSAATRDAYLNFGVYQPDTDSFRNLANGDTFWKTRFNTYTHLVNNVTKITHSPSGVNNVLARNLDATWTYAGGFVLPVVETTPGKIDATITNYYGDGTFERYRTVLIDDAGAIAPESAFAGISTGADYKGELLKWNYQQEITATEFNGRKIDLVVEPKIFIKSGLIQ